MFGLSKSILSDQDTAFQITTYQWLLKNFGGKSFYKNTKLILPTRDYFPARVGSDDEAAIEIFNSVKKYAGMEEWPCILERQEEDIESRVAPTIAVQNGPSNPLGTFQVEEDDEVVITYNPAIVSNPMQLVATYAHELAHYLTARVEEPPGGWDNWEFATDIAATFLGFGIFMVNSAVSFQQYTDLDSQGWQYSRSGYLSESEHIFALAIFLTLKKIPIKEALPHLKPSLRKLLKKAVKQVSLSEGINELLATDCVAAEPVK